MTYIFLTNIVFIFIDRCFYVLFFPMSRIYCSREEFLKKDLFYIMVQRDWPSFRRDIFLCYFRQINDFPSIRLESSNNIMNLK